MQDQGGANDPMSDTTLLAAQYSSMRAEMIKRQEIRSQLLALTLVVAGTFLSVGLQPNVPESALLVYPPLAMFLAASWKQSDVRTGQMASFIRKNIEPRIGPASAELGWENYRAKRFPTRSLTPFSVSGVFLATQGLAIALACVRFVPHILPIIQTHQLGSDYVEVGVDTVLLIGALFAMIRTFLLIVRRQRF